MVTRDSAVFAKLHQMALDSSVLARALDASRYITLSPVDAKVKFALQAVAAQIPFGLAFRITVVRYGPAGVLDPTFEVVFKSGKVVTFTNLDTFPTDADIARICVECP